MPAAKNALKCHMALSSVDAAVAQYQEWVSGNIFSAEQLESVRVFFEEVLKSKGITTTLEQRKAEGPPAGPEPAEPSPPRPVPGASATASMVQEPDISAIKIAPSAAALAAEAAAEEAAEEDPIEICSIEITPESGPKKGVPIELDVSAQTGNRLSVTVPSKDVAFIQDIEPGQALNDVQYFSHFVMFRGTGKVLAKRKLESGPRKGDFNLSLRMEAPTNQ